LKNVIGTTLALYNALSPKPLSGFYLSSLTKLKDVRSPSDPSSTLLIALVELLNENDKDEKIFVWFEQNLPIVKAASDELIGFLSSFPDLLKYLWLIDEELSVCDDDKARKNLESYKGDVEKKNRDPPPITR